MQYFKAPGSGRHAKTITSENQPYRALVVAKCVGPPVLVMTPLPCELIDTGLKINMNALLDLQHLQLRQSIMRLRRLAQKIEYKMV